MPGDSYAMDLAGTFKSNAGQYTYLLIVVDICTRFIILEPLVDKTVKCVAMALIKIFSLMGYPKHFTISDNGTEFKNELINNMFKLMAIDKRYITAYHPASNLSERFVQSTKKVLAKIMEGNGEDWHYYVPAVQLMLNNKVSKRLNSTPFLLMFARKMNDFVKYTDKDETKEMLYTTHEELMNRIDYISNIIFPAIAERTKAYTDIQKGIADKKHRIIDYPEESYAMVRVRDRYNNLSPAYQGPYSVVRKTEGDSYILKDEEGILMSRNYSPEELKLISQEEIVPEDELYIIEAIIDHRGEPGNREYLACWKNYTREDDSWIPSEIFTDPEVINQYWRRLGVKPSKEDIRKEKSYKKTKMLKQIQEMGDVDVTTNSTNKLRMHKSSSNKQTTKTRHSNVDK